MEDGGNGKDRQRYTPQDVHDKCTEESGAEITRVTKAWLRVQGREMVSAITSYHLH